MTIRSQLSLSRKALVYARRKGLLRSAKLGSSIAKAQISAKNTKRKKQFFFISHPINNTGAPLVLLEIIKDFSMEYGSKNVHLITPGIDTPALKKTIRSLGIKTKKAAIRIGFRVIAMQLGLHKNDFLLMNTVALYENYRNFVIHALETKRLERAYWFIHEDLAQLEVVTPELVENKPLLKRIRRLIDQEKLTILVPSEQAKKSYDEFFLTAKVQAVPLRVEVPQKFTAKRKPSDYKKVNFLISGTTSDGRKGQMIAIAAFQRFIDRHYPITHDKYRDFTLNLLGVDGNGFISEQVRWIGESALGKRLVITPSVPREDALEITSKCNAVICTSLSETFGLYVVEAMSMGHVILRNNSGGVDEQLRDNINGYEIDHHNINNVSAVIEKVLNRKTTTDLDLQRMGGVSQEIAHHFANNSYTKSIRVL